MNSHPDQPVPKKLHETLIITRCQGNPLRCFCGKICRVEAVASFHADWFKADAHPKDQEPSLNENQPG
jgi:hypothetical protein